MRSTFRASPGKKSLEYRDEVPPSNRRNTYKEQARRLVNQCLPAPVKQPTAALKEAPRAEGERSRPSRVPSPERLPPAPTAEKHASQKVTDAEAVFLKHAKRAFEKYHGAVSRPKAESQRRISRYEKQRKKKRNLEGDAFQSSIEHSSS